MYEIRGRNLYLFFRGDSYYVCHVSNDNIMNLLSNHGTVDVVVINEQHILNNNKW